MKSTTKVSNEKPSIFRFEFIFTNFSRFFAAPVTFLWNHLGNMQQERMSQQFPIKIEDTQNFPQIDEQSKSRKN